MKIDVVAARVGWIARRLAVVVACSACQPSNVFVCQADGNCVASGRPGRCEPVGFCSFPDPSCASDWRYGKHAGDGLGGMCVEPDGQGGTSPSTGSGTQVTSGATGTTLPLGTDTAITSGATTSGDSSSSTGPPVDRDLVLYFAFEEDPTVIGGAFDSSGNALDGQCAPCPTSTPGVRGNAALFGDAWFIVPHDPLLDLDVFTIELWYSDRNPDGMGFDMMVGRPLGTGILNSFEVLTSPGNLADAREIRFDLATQAGFQFHIVPSPFDLDTWHHLAFVYDGALNTIYADGQALATVAMDPPDYDTNDLYVGVDIDNGSFINQLEGALDELRIYSRALTAAEIDAIAAGGS